MSFYLLSSPAKLVVQALGRKKKPLAEFSSFSLNFKPIAANNNQLALFKQMFNTDSQLPSYLFVQAFPYIVQTLVKSAIPSPLVGLVHLSTKFIQHNSHDYNQPAEIEVSMLNGEQTAKGIAYTVTCQFIQQGHKTITNENVFLAKTQGKQSKSNIARADFDAESQAVVAQNHITAKQAWQYAKLSKDFNPIHLHPWLAKLLGMKTTLVHGMYNCHRALANLPELHLPDFRVIEITFKRPCFLPSQVILTQPNLSQASVYSADMQHLHLDIKLTLSGDKTS